MNKNLTQNLQKTLLTIFLRIEKPSKLVMLPLIIIVTSLK